MKRRNWVTKKIAAGLATVMLISIMGCGDQRNTDVQQGDAAVMQETDTQKEETGKGDTMKGEPVHLVIHSQIAEQEDMDSVMEALNEYTLKKLNITVEYVFHGGNYSDKINVIIASGEEYDACFTSSWLNSYNANVAKGAFVDIKDMLPEYAPNLLEAIPEWFWEACTIDGGIYGVPNQQIVAVQRGIAWNAEILDALDYDTEKVKSIADMEEYAQMAYDEYGVKVLECAYSAVALVNGYELVSDYLSCGAIKMGDDSASVVNFYETEEWKEHISAIKNLADKGLFESESAYSGDVKTNLRNTGKFSFYAGEGLSPGVDATLSQKYGTEFRTTDIGVDPYVSTSSVVATMFGISATSKHPVETLQYLELVNTDPYVMNLLAYGIEGKHYNKLEDGKVELIADSGYSHGSSWAFGNVFLTYPLSTQDADVWEQTEELNESAEKSPILGFSFDAEPVKVQIANVNTVVLEYSTLTTGEMPIEETNAEFIEKLKVAGVDEIIAEMQRQIDEFLASK